MHPDLCLRLDIGPVGSRGCRARTCRRGRRLSSKARRTIPRNRAAAKPAAAPKAARSSGPRRRPTRRLPNPLSPIRAGPRRKQIQPPAPCGLAPGCCAIRRGTNNQQQHKPRPSPRNRLNAANDPGARGNAANDPRKQFIPSNDPNNRFGAITDPRKRFGAVNDPRNRFNGGLDPRSRMRNALDYRRQLLDHRRENFLARARMPVRPYFGERGFAAVPPAGETRFVPQRNGVPHRPRRDARGGRGRHAPAQHDDRRLREHDAHRRDHVLRPRRR